MSEWRLVVMAAGVAISATLGRWFTVPIGPLPIVIIGALIVYAAVGRRNATLLLLGLVLIAFGRSRHAESNYEPLAPGPFDGWIELVTDPEPSRFGTSVEAILPSRARVLVSAGWEHHRLELLTAGSRVMVSGQVRSIEATDWTRSRHLLGRLTVDAVGASTDPAWWRQPSEWMRSGVRSGGAQLDPRWEPLYTGLVVGDDRLQAAGQQARFRVAGLSHLLAVSGQNVAFVLAVAAPLLQRLGSWSRLTTTIGLLVIFALATRLEPSVLRATATAITSVWAVHTGARASGVRALAIAVVSLLIIDPFLVWSIGFRLSIAASLGILVVSPMLDRRLRARTTTPPGVPPGADATAGSWWRTPLSITVGAQLGVAPLLVVAFGPVALVSIPANLMAGWAAGFVMAWGFSGGLVAGLVGDRLGSVVQIPATLAMWWIDTVASVAIDAPSPVVGGGASLGAMAALAVAWAAAPTLRPAVWISRVVGAVLLIASIPNTPNSPTVLPGGAHYWPAGDDDRAQSVLVLAGGADDRLLEAVIRLRLGSVDAVVSENGGRMSSDVIRELRDVIDVGSVIAPPQHRIVGGTRLLRPIEVRVGHAMLRIEPDGDDRLMVDASRDP